MAPNMATNDYLFGQCQEFAKPHQLVRVEVSEVSIPNLLVAYLLLSDCTCGKPTQHSPSYVLPHEIVELHDQSKLQVLCSKHIAHHRGQRLRDVKVAPHGGMESLQIYLSESQMGVRSDLAQSATQFRKTQPWWRGS
jgi:hypothetical protein